jgi:hypothetical protein
MRDRRKSAGGNLNARNEPVPAIEVITESVSATGFINSRGWSTLGFAQGNGKNGAKSQNRSTIPVEMRTLFCPALKKRVCT